MIEVQLLVCPKLSHTHFNYNNVSFLSSSEGGYIKCYWKDLRVGDIVRLSCDEMIPADILLLRSSDEHGICFIDTQNLDGEANLKQREAPRGFADKVRSRLSNLATFFVLS